MARAHPLRGSCRSLRLMWGRRKRIKTPRTDSLIGRQTEVSGDIKFADHLIVQGTVKGDVAAEDHTASVIYVDENGTIEGEVRVPNVVLNGMVIGDVYAKQHIELRANARITGNVYYRLIEMAIGAEVNGNLVRVEEELEPPLKLRHEPPIEPPVEAAE